MASTHDTKENEPGAVTSIGLEKTIQPNVLHVNMTKQVEVKPSPHVVILVDVDYTESKLEMLEESLRAIEGGRNFDFGNALWLSLVSDVVIPPKFKLP